jgi:glycosyltransferase involved in cell wall biosynthesis
MRILIVSSSFFPKIDGSTRCVYDHARKLVAKGHTVCLVTRAVKLNGKKEGDGSFGSNRQEILEGIRIYRSGVSLRSSTNWGFEKLRLALEQILIILGLQRRMSFNVIHVHGYSACYAAILCKFIFRIPLVITTHGTEFLWPRSVRWKSPFELKVGLIFEKMALNFCDVVIAQSLGVKKYMLKLYGQQISKKIRIIPTGVDHEKFRPYEKNSSEPQILFAGALSEIKGVSCLIKAFSKLQKVSPDARLVLIGSGASVDRYKNMVKQMGLERNVDFLGPVRDDLEMIEHYKNSDVVVLPSNVGGPISCTILEGLSSGRPVISTNVPGGIPDIVNSEVGALIEREDVDTLANELIKFISDEDYKKQIGVNARRQVEQLYTLDFMVKELEKLYKEIGKNN